MDELSKYRSAPARELIGKLLDEPIDGLIRLFYDCVYVREDELVRLLPGEGLRTLETLDLVGRDPDTPGLVFATAAILNAQNLTVCDRGNAPDGTKCTLPPDVVYPAIFENTREFVDRLPLHAMRGAAGYRHGHRDRGDAGACLRAPRLGQRYIARCTLFAEFNRRLAGPEKHDGGGRRYVRAGGGADVRPDRDAPAVYSRAGRRS